MASQISTVSSTANSTNSKPLGASSVATSSLSSEVVPFQAKAENLSQTAVSPQPEHLNGANIFLRSLIAQGVDTIFGYPGGVILPIYEALADYPELHHLLTRHEQGATHMAEGYARSTGKPGVVLVTSGPGATNLVTGLTDAYYDSVPLVAFTGNVPANMLGNDAFQEADIVGMTRACTKHNVIVRDVADLARAIKEAFYIATTGRPGPVLVDIPKDVINALHTFEAGFDYQGLSMNLPGYQPFETIGEPDNTAAVEELLGLIQSAQRPVILAGGGVVNGNASAQLKAFAERFCLPVGCSLMGLGGFEANHPLYMGFTGMHGHFWANMAIAQADLLIVCGNRLNERQTGKADRFARNAKMVHIDLDPSNFQKNVAAFLPIAGNVKTILGQAVALSQQTQPPSQSDFEAARAPWLETIASFKARRPTESQCPAGYITPQWAIERIFAHIPQQNSFVTTEVGQHQMWAAQRFNLNTPRSFISSGGLGTMGFGFPAAIGIQAAHPTATVVDIAGDGSFQMTLQELIVAKQYGLPVKVAIINNGHLGMIRQWQGKMYGRESEATMANPDYVKLAEAYGCKGLRVKVNQPGQLDAVLAEAMATTDCPVLIDIEVAEKADVYPWVPAGGANEDMLTDTSLDEKEELA